MCNLSSNPDHCLKIIFICHSPSLHLDPLFIQNWYFRSHFLQVTPLVFICTWLIKKWRHNDTWSPYRAAEAFTLKRSSESHSVGTQVFLLLSWDEPCSMKNPSFSDESCSFSQSTECLALRTCPQGFLFWGLPWWERFAPREFVTFFCFSCHNLFHLESIGNWAFLFLFIYL